jgi:hypothetical protein
MKNMIALVMLVVSGLSQATTPLLDFPEPGKMTVNLLHWRFVAHEENYNMYMDRESVGANKSVIELLSVVSFDAGKEWNYWLVPNIPIKHIVAHGNLYCEHEAYIIRSMWYVDAEDNLVRVERYQFGEFGSEMGVSGTARNAMLLMACKSNL